MKPPYSDCLCYLQMIGVVYGVGRTMTHPILYFVATLTTAMTGTVPNSLGAQGFTMGHEFYKAFKGAKAI